MQVNVNKLVRLSMKTKNYWIDPQTLFVLSVAGKVVNVIKPTKAGHYGLSINGRKQTFTKSQIREIVKTSGVIAVKPAPTVVDNDDEFIHISIDPNYLINVKKKAIFSLKTGRYLKPAVDGSYILSTAGRQYRYTQKQIQNRIRNYTYQMKKAGK